jgi:hypothetical protein
VPLEKLALVIAAEEVRTVNVTGPLAVPPVVDNANVPRLPWVATVEVIVRGTHCGISVMVLAIPDEVLADR